MPTVVTTTTAHTSLLLGKMNSAVLPPGGRATSPLPPSSFPDVYHFLRGAMNLEFVLTRWSFFTSLLFFLVGVSSRLLLELQLLKPQPQQQRNSAAWAVVCGSTLFFLCTMISQINCTLNCWPNLMVMTAELVQLLWFEQQPFQTKTTTTTAKLSSSPMKKLSMFFFVGTAACALYESIHWWRHEIRNQPPRNSQIVRKKDSGDKTATTKSKPTNISDPWM